MRFLLMITATLLLLLNVAQAQQSVIDSLEKELERKNLPDSLRMELLSNLAYTYQTLSPVKSFEYIEEGMGIAQKQNNQKYIAQFLAYLGSTNWYIGDYPNALYNTLQSLKINEKIGNNRLF